MSSLLPNPFNSEINIGLPRAVLFNLEKDLVKYGYFVAKKHNLLHDLELLLPWEKR